MNEKTVLAALRFVASQIDGELFQYEDGYIIELLIGNGYKILLEYELDGELSGKQVKEL